MKLPIPILSAVLLVSNFTLAQAPAETSSPSIDSRASTLVREMADFLESQSSLRVEASGVVEVVTNDGQRIETPYASKVVVKRPNKLSSERVGQTADAKFLYDGRNFTVFGRRANVYAQAPAPATLDRAIDEARDRLGIEAPAADFLYTDAFEGLMSGVTSGTYLGEAVLDGVPVEHVAFRGEEVDWQLWIEKGARPVPRRYVITSKTVEGAPQFRVDMKSWNFASKPSNAEFAFTPPPGARKIEFLNRTPAKDEAGVGGSGGEIEQ